MQKPIIPLGVMDFFLLANTTLTYDSDTINYINITKVTQNT